MNWDYEKECAASDKTGRKVFLRAGGTGVVRVMGHDPSGDYVGARTRPKIQTSPFGTRMRFATVAILRDDMINERLLDFIPKRLRQGHYYSRARTFAQAWVAGQRKARGGRK